MQPEITISLLRHDVRRAVFPTCGDRIVELAQPGDLIVVMGARDDTLSEFAADVLRRVGEKSF